MRHADDNCACPHPARPIAGRSLSERVTDRRIAAALQSGVLFSIRRGWFMDAADRESLRPEQRHHAHVIAVARDASGSAVMSHASAAVLWGLPLYAHAPRPCPYDHSVAAEDLECAGRVPSCRAAPDLRRHSAQRHPVHHLVAHGVRSHPRIDAARGRGTGGCCGAADGGAAVGVGHGCRPLLAA